MQQYYNNSINQKTPKDEKSASILYVKANSDFTLIQVTMNPKFQKNSSRGQVYILSLYIQKTAIIFIIIVNISLYPKTAHLGQDASTVDNVPDIPLQISCDACSVTKFNCHC